MDKIEFLLSLTPSLVHLRLEGSADDTIFDSSRWEKFIRTKLLSLNRFEFCFRSQNPRLIRLSTVVFRTPFWLTEKCWPVHFIYDTPKEQFLVCSAPEMLKELEYQFFGPITISSTIQNTAFPMTDNKSYRQALFHRVTELELSEYVLDSCHHMSTLIDSSQITKLKMQLSFHAGFLSKTREKLIDLLQRTNHLRLLEIFFDYRFTTDPSLIEQICSIVPDHVQHLDIEAMNFNGINLVLLRLQYLSSVTFRRLCLTTLSTVNLTEWRKQLKRNITCRLHHGSLHIWLD